MRTYIKYFLLVLCIFVFAGCNNQTGNTIPEDTGTEMQTIQPSPTSAETAPPETEIPEYKTDVMFTVFKAETFKADDFKDYRNSWQFLIQQKFNIRIIVHDILTYGKPWEKTTGETNILAEVGENVFSEIDDFRESGVISAYNDYLSKSAAWNSLPESFRTAFQDTDGNIWAIPKSEKVSVLARAYNSEWLDFLKMKTPENINELYEILNAYTYEDPDGNGVNDTYGTSVASRTTSLHSFKDVFEANSCRLTYTYNKAFRNGEDTVIYKAVPVGYNPESGMIEDYSTTGGMKNSLVYIKGLIDNGIVNIASNSMPGGNFLKEEYGSQYGLLDENLMNTAKYKYTFSLNDKSEKNATSLPMADEGYFMFSKTIDKEKIVPMFVDLFYGTKEGYETAFTGITGDNFKYKETADGFIVNERFRNNVTHIELVGEVSWFDLNIKRPYLHSSFKIINTDELLQDPRMYVVYPKQMAFMENFTAGYADGTGGSAKYEKDINSVFAEFYKGNISPEDLITEMEKLNQIYDIESLIKQTNERWLTGN